MTTIFCLIQATGQILRDGKSIGKVRRIDGGKHVATAMGKTAEALSAEFAAETCCRMIDKMGVFTIERGKKK